METWKMAIRNVGRRKLRTTLTVLGIVVGVGMMLALLSIVSGMDVRVTQMVRALGGADITIYNATIPARGSQPFGGFGFTIQRTINLNIIQQIIQIPGVYAVSPQLSFMGYIENTRVTIHGIDPQTYNEVTSGLNIINGRMLSTEDSGKIVLGKTLMEALNITISGKVKVGTSTTDQQEFEVIGEFETGIMFQEYAAYITLKDAQKITGLENEATQILVKCEDPYMVNEVANTITSYIPGIRVTTPTAMVTQATQLLNTLTMFFATIGLIALVAGSFGVVNTMLMSVSERTREIGILKAIGAKSSDILKMFLAEAIIIGSLGGVIGVAVGGVLAYILPTFMPGIMGTASILGRTTIRGVRQVGSTQVFTPTLTPTNITICIGLGVLVGLIAGLYPAWRASRMKPVEALRHV
ncbi:MAG: ABC transporter permease [archaeon GBS-70-058]|nr:ABC transporter permease [Candidatus Culexarchaeum nevadense]